jgi:hypothetical protein
MPVTSDGGGLGSESDSDRRRDSGSESDDASDPVTVATYLPGLATSDSS